MFDTKIKLVKQKTKKFMISNVLLAQTQVKLKNSNFFHVFVQIFEKHNSKKIFKVYGFSYFYVMRKTSWHVLLLFSKMNSFGVTLLRFKYLATHENC